MTDAERERVAHYFRTLADRMGLKDWIVAVESVPAEDGVAAKVKCISGRKVAVFRLHGGWADDSPEDLRQTCVHELLHCHFAAMREDIERRLRPLDYETFEMLFEYGIDAVAEAWAPSLPLMLTLENDDMGRQKTAKGQPDTAQPKPKAGPKPAPKAPKGGKGAK